MTVGSWVYGDLEMGCDGLTLTPEGPAKQLQNLLEGSSEFLQAGIALTNQSKEHINNLVYAHVRQLVRCCLLTHQKQNPSAAHHRPSDGQCPLHPHTQEGPEIPTAVCK